MFKQNNKMREIKLIAKLGILYYWWQYLWKSYRKEKLRSFVKCKKLENSKNKGILGKGDIIVKKRPGKSKKKLGSEHPVTNQCKSF